MTDERLPHAHPLHEDPRVAALLADVCAPHVEMSVREHALEALARCHDPAVESCLLTLFQAPISRRDAEAGFRYRVFRQLQRVTGGRVCVLMPDPGPVFTDPAAGESRRGRLVCTQGAGLYDFHFEYPIEGDGVPKEFIRVPGPEGDVDVVTWCRQQQVTVICSRCLMDITAMGELESCVRAPSVADRLVEAFRLDADAEGPLEELPERGVCLGARAGRRATLLLWRWRLWRDEPDLAEVAALGERYAADEVWVAGRLYRGPTLRYGYARVPSGEGGGWQPLPDGVVGAPGVAPLTRAGYAAARAAAREREEQAAREERARAEQSRARRRARLAKRALPGWEPLRAACGEHAVEGRARPGSGGTFELQLLSCAGGRLRQGDLERVAETAATEVLSAAEKRRAERMLCAWHLAWVALAREQDALFAAWLALQAPWRARRAAFDEAREARARERDALIAQEAAGEIDGAELVRRLGALRAGGEGVSDMHPDRWLFERLQQAAEAQLDRSVPPWILALFLDDLRQAGGG